MSGKQKIALLPIIVISCLVFLSIAACSVDKTASDYAANTVIERDTLTQISTIDAILGGIYDGVVDYEILKSYGDFGIGTFAGLNGEMLALDGDFYQIKADGVAYPVNDSDETPFAAVTYFDVDDEWGVPSGIDYNGFQEFLDELLPTENTFYAIRVDGTFSYMKTRSVPAQTKPYPPLVEVTKDQPEFEFENEPGTLVGFRCPPYAAGVNVVGYHLHFLNESKNAGGHVLEFTVENGTVKIDNTQYFLMILPHETSDFYDIDLSLDNQEELELAEK